MKLDIDDLLSTRSYMITVDDVGGRYSRRLELEQKIFEYHGLQMPRPFFGASDAKPKFHKACDKSHCLVLEMAEKSNYPNVLVFEDDAYPCNNVVKLLTEALEDVPDGIDILQLGFNDNTNIDVAFTNRNGVEFSKVSKSIPREDDGNCTGFHAVIYFQSSFKKIQKIVSERRLPIDQIQKFFNSYVLKLPLFIQYDPVRYGNHPYVKWSKQPEVLAFYNNYPTIDKIVKES